MARVVVIGATGHVGTYLVPRLVEAGHEVIAVSRGTSEPYLPHAAWKSVETRQMDRAALERDGSFGRAIRALKADIVIDKICFTLDSARELGEALNGHIGHLLHTGTIWTHGHSLAVPTREDAPKAPFGEYGIQKKAIEDYLLEAAKLRGLPVTLIHPGHIVGRGWAPLNPAGHFNLAAFQTIARGEQLTLANFGLETVHHVHADDIAALFMAAIGNWRASTGEAFHAVSEQALTLRGYAEAMYRWFGHEPNLAYKPYDAWKADETPEDAKATWEHIARSPNCSMAKARHTLDFRPRYSSLEAVQESVGWLIDKGKIKG
ncbi:NAD(P)-dependent oxidoreductase [Rhizobium sp. SIMBA_035]